MPTRTLLDLDVPSGELIVGSDLGALAPLPPGQGSYSINTAQGQARQAQAQAASHLIEVYLGDSSLRLFQSSRTGRLRLSRAWANPPRGYKPVTDDIRGVIHLMDGADYDAQVTALGRSGTVHERLSVTPGRYRFAVGFEALFSFEDETPDSFAWFTAERTGRAHPIVRAALPANANHPSHLSETAMGQFLAAYVPRLLGAFPHPAQAIVELLTGYGAGLQWHRGLLTDQTILQPDLRAPVSNRRVSLPSDLVLPTFPALEVLGTASVDQVTARGDVRSAILDAPLDADPYWLALGLVVFQSLLDAPDVIIGSSPDKDAQARDEVVQGYAHLCDLVTRSNRWDDLRQALPLLTPLVALMAQPASTFSLRRTALAMLRDQADAPSPPTKGTRGRRP